MLFRSTWWGNSIGRIDRVLKPFEAIRVTKSEQNTTRLSVVRREYQLDGLGLPTQIQANGGPVLAAPTRMVVTIDGKDVIVQPTAPLSITQTHDWRVEFTGKGTAAGLQFDIKGNIEQDGLVDLSLTYAPSAHPVTVQGLRVEFALDDAQGTWMAAIGMGGNYASRTIGKVPAGQGVVWDTKTVMSSAGTGMTVGNWLEIGRAHV